LIIPGLKQACPTVAACWSPAMPVIGSGAPNRSAGVAPKSALQSRTSGRMAAGMSNSSSSSWSQSWRWMSKIMVRAALVASVACTFPPDRRHSRNESTVPKAISPRSDRSRVPGIRSSSQAILVAEK
jgi:hypothetical protein